MSDFDEKDVIKGGGDFDAADIISEAPKAPKHISTQESFNRGIQQGGTLGGAPIVQGAVETVMDKLRSFGIDPTTSIFEGMKADGPAVTDTNALLASQGFKGDIGPQTSGDLYRDARDASTAEFDAASAANPIASLAGNIAGGIATLPAMPAKMIAPLGPVAEGAGIGAKMLRAAQNGIPTAALASANMSKGDLTKGEFDKVAADTVAGTALSIPLSAGLQGLGTGIYNTGAAVGGLASKVIPEVTKIARNRTKAGINVFGDEFYNNHNKALNEVASEMEAPITAKSQAQKTEHENYLANLEQQETALKADFDNMTAEAQAHADLEVQRQTAKNVADVERINKQSVETARNLQKHVIDTRKKLGQKYNELDQAAEATGIYPDNREALSSFVEEIGDNAGLPESDLNAIVKKLEPVLGGEGATPQGFRNTKQVLNKLFDHGNPVVRRAAKAAYAKTKANYAQELEAGGYKDLAADIADTNKKWMATAEIENEFVDNLKPNRVTGEVEVAPASIDAVKTFGRNNPKEIAKSDFMGNILNVMDPEGSPAQIKAMQDLAAEANQVKNFKPVAPELPEMPPEKVSELERLQDLLKQAKSVKAGNPMDVVPGAMLPKEPQQVKNTLIKNVPKYEQKSGDTVVDNTLESIMSFLKKEKGEDFVSNLKPKIKTLSEDSEVIGSIAGAENKDIPINTYDVLRKIVGKSAVSIGKMAGEVENAAAGAKNFMTKPRSFLKTGVTDLTDASNEQITMMAENMAKQGPEGQAYARVLNEAQSKQGQSRSAVMFGLMQQPQFRELMNKMNMESDNVSEPVK